jgi:glutamine synthetase
MNAFRPYAEKNRAVAEEDGSRALLKTVRWIVLSIPDLNGALRGKALARTVFSRGIDSGGLSSTDLVLRTDALDSPISTGDARFDGGDLRFVPDLNTLAVDPWRPGWANCLAFTRWRDGSPCEIAPRDVCAAVLADLEELGFAVHAAFEYEFRLYERETGRPVTPAASYSHHLLGELRGFVDDLAVAAIAAGIDLQAFHTEAGAGLVEVSVGACDGLRAADVAVLLRSCVRAAAARHEMRASFAAKPRAGEEGSGGHLHLSLNNRDGISLFASEGSAADQLPNVMRHAIGGLLAHLAPMSALYNPHVNSYKRLLPGCFAPTRADWAFDGRDVAVRVVVSGRPEARHLELRRGGADANPYLVLAAAVVSIADGLQRELEPPGDGSGVPAPSELRGALSVFAEDTEARRGLGESFCRHWETTREWELQAFNEVVTTWELTRVEG